MPKQPSFVQLDPDALQKTAIDYNVAGYKRADEDAYQRLGGLYPARDAAVENAAFDLTNQDPVYNSAFKMSGLGDVDLGKTAETRSLNLRQPILSGAARNRNFFSALWKQNPERTFGLGTGDLVNIATSNSGNQVNFQNAINQINATNASTQQQEQAALIGSLIKGVQPVVGAAVNAVATPSAASPYLNSSTYNDPVPYSGDTDLFGASATGTAAIPWSGPNDLFGSTVSSDKGGGW